MNALTHAGKRSGRTLTLEHRGSRTRDKGSLTLDPMDFRFHTTSFLCEGATMVLIMAFELTFSTPAEGETFPTAALWGWGVGRQRARFDSLPVLIQ